MLILLSSIGGLAAAETPRAWLLWDGVESVERYAKRAKLPATETLDLGNNVRLELVLIPAGQFMMGTPEPREPAETAIVGQAILYSGTGVALAFVLLVLIRAIAKRQRPKFSLRWLLGLTVAASIAVYGAVRWHKANVAWREYSMAMARFAKGTPEEKPAHDVMLTKPFYIGKFPVTREQYLQVIDGQDLSSFKNDKDNPMETVAWSQAQDFCIELTKRTDRAVRLPTEAEWEYSCRAGTTTTYYFGDSREELDRAAWYSGNSKSTTHPVGMKEPNTFGLYDMHGNVWQWCQDGWDECYYAKSPRADPQGPAPPCKNQVMRGGSWYDDFAACRSASRQWNAPYVCTACFGFRVAMSVSRTP